MQEFSPQGEYDCQDYETLSPCGDNPSERLMHKGILFAFRQSIPDTGGKGNRPRSRRLSGQQPQKDDPSLISYSVKILVNPGCFIFDELINILSIMGMPISEPEAGIEKLSV